MTTTLYWLVQRLEDVPEKSDWLSASEEDVLAGFRFSKRRNDWRVGRWTAKQAVKAYLSNQAVDSASLEVRAAEDGAPEVFWNGEPLPVSISISHSSGLGLCVVGPPDFSVGCDMEQVQPREVRFFQDYFTPEEISILDSGAEDRSLAAYLIWCAKESVLKSLREGLRMDTRSIIIRPSFGSTHGEWRTWTGECVDTQRHFSGWWRTMEGFVIAVTADKPTACPKALAP